jgi:uncharacterized membrane protein YbhN (UPF0104 family)/soluble lytic murein transglycosylase-like protein
VSDGSPASGLSREELRTGDSTRVGNDPPRAPKRRRWRWVGVLVVVLAAALSLLLVALLAPDGRQTLVPRPDLGATDPLAFAAGDEARRAQEAAAGFAHPLMTRSPGGVVASAERTAAFRRLIDAAAKGHGVDPAMLEGLVLLESAGRPDVVAGPDAAAAAGLTQILAETATSFLAMPVDLEASRRLTRQIAAADEAGDRATVEALREQRRRIDARFDPAQALAGTVLYLERARQRFGRPDLALVSYHMGIGNLEALLRSYADADPETPIATVVREHDLSWARVYFTASPEEHRDAWLRLAAFADDSQTYYWRVLAARRIMRLFRDDRGRLERLALLHERKPSAEDVLRPPSTTDRLTSPSEIEAALREHSLHPLPEDPALVHFAVDEGMGALAPRLGREPSLYRNLRGETLAVLVYLADRVHALSGADGPLLVTTSVRDEAYERLMRAEGATIPRYSVLTTGHAFELRRRYESAAQAAAVQYVLDRLQAQNLIAWTRDGEALRVAVGDGGWELVPEVLEPASRGGYLERVADATRVFAHRLTSVEWTWIGLAILLHLTKMAARARSWQMILSASYPDSRVRWRSVFGAYAAGVGVNAVVPARGGDVLKLFLIKRSVGGATYPTLAATLLVETMFDFVVSSALVAWALATGVLPGVDVLRRLPEIDWSFPFRHPWWSAAAAGAALVALAVGLALGRRRVADLHRRVAQGFAVLHPPRRYLRTVVPWQCLDWLLRLASIFCFLRAFGIGASVENALRVQVTSSLSTILPFTPAGIGTEQALLAFTLAGEASTGAILSFSVGMKLTIVAVNVVLGALVIALMLRTLRIRNVIAREQAVRRAEEVALDT